jgi:hypothetical protein
VAVVVDAAVAGAEAVVAAEAVAALEGATAAVAVEGAAAVVAFGYTGVAEAAWGVRDAQLAGGAFRPRLCISIRRPRRRADRH